jgi:hypothetical protein
MVGDNRAKRNWREVATNGIMLFAALRDTQTKSPGAEAPGRSWSVYLCGSAGGVYCLDRA